MKAFQCSCRVQSAHLHKSFLGRQFPRRSYRALNTPQIRKSSVSAGIGSSNLHSPPDPTDSFLHGGSTRYLDEMYHAWFQDPTSVHLSWQVYFRDMDDPSVPASRAFQPPPGLISTAQKDAQFIRDRSISGELKYQLIIREIVDAFRQYGHTKARTNPLGNVGEKELIQETCLPNLQALEARGFDLDRKVRLNGDLFHGSSEGEASTLSIRELMSTYERIYCSSVGVEFHHIFDTKKTTWLSERIETMYAKPPTVEEKKTILESLIRGTLLERFLASKFPNEKRFGIDGSEAMVPGMAALIDRASDTHGVSRIILSQCHRGRMNIMSSVYGQDYDLLFRQYAGAQQPDIEDGHSGDVKYHYGMEGTRRTAQGNDIHISVLPNPSHLEATGPVAQGAVRAVQVDTKDTSRSNIMSIALHTDAAISGQGSVYEVMNLSKLEGYEVGGTVRVTVNNQIGFTTDARSARSTRYCTDIAKFIEMPIFHVNSDDPEAVVAVFKLAADYRAEFQSDCMIDFVCYRRFGHNEIDQASFTQPEMYKVIAQKQSLLEAYSEKLVDEGCVTEKFIEERRGEFWDLLEQKLAQSKEAKDEETVAGNSSMASDDQSTSVSTAVEESVLSDITENITTVPEGFTPHRSLLRILEGKKKDFSAGTIDWSTSEALAFGCLLREGYDVRLSGEDVERGTFSQRHSVFHDQQTYQKWTPLNNLNGGQAHYTAYNSPLTEFGVLGFDYGYSTAAKKALVMWEAQFGDFVNNAQVMVDQFIASGEAKWKLCSNIVLSLPHGYDGQGPEHSSARLGRFLELCNEDPRSWPEDAMDQRKKANISVIMPTTPANYFHVIRRQVMSEHKKPLILLFSKSLLRHPLARSSISDISGSTRFEPVLPDIETPTAPSKVIFCSGQVFAALHKHRKENEITDTAIVRIEELHPFPYSQVDEILEQYTDAKDVVWCQEEPYNGGAWHFVRDRLEVILEKSGRKLRYAGRPPAAAIATGSKKMHLAEEKKFLDEAFR